MFTFFYKKLVTESDTPKESGYICEEIQEQYIPEPHERLVTGHPTISDSTGDVSPVDASNDEATQTISPTVAYSIMIDNVPSCVVFSESLAYKTINDLADQRMFSGYHKKQTKTSVTVYYNDEFISKISYFMVPIKQGW